MVHMCSVSLHGQSESVLLWLASQLHSNDVCHSKSHWPERVKPNTIMSRSYRWVSDGRSNLWIACYWWSNKIWQLRVMHSYKTITNIHWICIKMQIDITLPKGSQTDCRTSIFILLVDPTYVTSRCRRRLNKTNNDDVFISSLILIHCVYLHL